MTDGNEGHDRKENIRRRLDAQPMGLKERLISIIPRSKDWCDNASKKRITTIAGAVVVAIGLGLGIVKYSNYSNERRLELQIGEKSQEISELKDRKSALNTLYTQAKERADNFAKTNRDIAAVAQRKKASLDSVSDVVGRLEARAANADSMINNARQIAKNLEERTTKAERERKEYLEIFPYETKSLALTMEEGRQNGKSIVVLGFEERYSEEPKEIKGREGIRKRFDSSYPGLFDKIKDGAGKKRVDRVRIEETSQEKVYTCKVSYDGGSSREVTYKHPDLINPTGGK